VSPPFLKQLVECISDICICITWLERIDDEIDEGDGADLPVSTTIPLP
jgi:hypothetical protein